MIGEPGGAVGQVTATWTDPPGGSATRSGWQINDTR